MRTTALILAAGAGERYGGPKALARDDDGTWWLQRAVQSVAACDAVVVVLGAAAADALELVPESVRTVVASDWGEGMSASMRAGIGALDDSYDAALVTLVDLPDVDERVVARVLESASGPDVLARATYDSVPGHPVLLGRAHWPGVVAGAAGDVGAKHYLAAHAAQVALIECGDLATGADRDTR